MRTRGSLSGRLRRGLGGLRGPRGGLLLCSRIARMARGVLRRLLRKVRGKPWWRVATLLSRRAEG